MTDGARFGALLVRDSIMSILRETPDLSVLPGSRWQVPILLLVNYAALSRRAWPGLWPDNPSSFKNSPYLRLSPAVD